MIQPKIKSPGGLDYFDPPMTPKERISRRVRFEILGKPTQVEDGYQVCTFCGELLLTGDLAISLEYTPGVVYYAHRHNCRDRESRDGEM